MKQQTVQTIQTFDVVVDQPTVRPAQRTDVSEILRIDHAVWKTGKTTSHIISSRIDQFSDGVPVCEYMGQMVGYGTMVRLEEYPDPITWENVSAGGTIVNHKPNGPILYGVSLTGLPGITKGISESIFEYAFNLFLESDCRTFALGSRIPGFARWSEKNPDLSVQSYIHSTRGGRPIDPELRLYQSLGFTIGHALPNYFPDSESLDYGVLIYVNK